MDVGTGWTGGAFYVRYAPKQIGARYFVLVNPPEPFEWTGLGGNGNPELFESTEHKPQCYNVAVVGLELPDACK